MNQSSIDQQDVERLPVPLPPLSLQRKFVERQERVLNILHRQRESLTELDRLFTSLQHRAFRGEL